MSELTAPVMGMDVVQERSGDSGHDHDHDSGDDPSGGPLHDIYEGIKDQLPGWVTNPNPNPPTTSRPDQPATLSPAERARQRAEREGIEVRNVVTIQPGTSSHKRLQRVADDHTVVHLAAGTHEWSHYAWLRDRAYDDLAIVGDGPGQTELTFPRNYNGWAILTERGEGIMFADFGLDQRASGCLTGLYTRADDRLVVSNIEWHGEGRPANPSLTGWNDGDPKETNALSPAINSPGGHGKIERLTAVNGGIHPNYHNGRARVGVFCGKWNKGTLDFHNCRIEEFPNNGFYAAMSSGATNIYNCEVHNCAVTQVRVNGISEVVNTNTSFDTRTSGVEDAYREGHATQCISVESYRTPGETLIKGCTATLGRVGNAQTAIDVWPGSTAMKIVDTEIEVSSTARRWDGTSRHLVADNPHGNEKAWPFPGGRKDVTLRDVTLSGSASEGPAITVRGGRPVHRSGLKNTTSRPLGI